MYADGRGVAQDDKAAVQWLSKAAQQGHAGAQFNLGWMYREGQDVPQDNIRAYMWTNLAVFNGAGTEARDKIVAKMTSDDIEKTQRLARDCLNYHPNYLEC